MFRKATSSQSVLMIAVIFSAHVFTIEQSFVVGLEGLTRTCTRYETIIELVEATLYFSFRPMECSSRPSNLPRSTLSYRLVTDMP